MELDRKEALRVLQNGQNVKRSICEVLREAYDFVYKLPDSGLKENITERLVTATIFAKKMDAKLREYKEDYQNNGFFPQNDDYEVDKGVRRGRNV